MLIIMIPWYTQTSTYIPFKKIKGTLNHHRITLNSIKSIKLQGNRSVSCALVQMKVTTGTLEKTIVKKVNGFAVSSHRHVLFFLILPD